jgi:hypothetical protein
VTPPFWATVSKIARKGEARCCGCAYDEGVVSRSKERFMLKLRFGRVLYFMGVVTMFVVAAGADRKFCH